jgi:hypothetical protein
MIALIRGTLGIKGYAHQNQFDSGLPLCFDCESVLLLFNLFQVIFFNTQYYQHCKRMFLLLSSPKEETVIALLSLSLKR